MVIDSTKYITVDKIDIKKSILSLSNSSYKDSIKTKIVFIVSGNCYAGNELNKIKIIKTNEKKACHLILPNAKILNAVINPSDFNLFFDGGNWSEKEVQQIKSNAVKKIKLLAIENGIIKKANERTTKLLNNFLNSVGYEKITIEFKNDILENNKILKNN